MKLAFLCLAGLAGHWAIAGAIRERQTEPTNTQLEIPHRNSSQSQTPPSTAVVQFCDKAGFSGDIDACVREVNECRKIYDFNTVKWEKLTNCVRAHRQGLSRSKAQKYCADAGYVDQPLCSDLYLICHRREQTTTGVFWSPGIAKCFEDHRKLNNATQFCANAGFDIDDNLAVCRDEVAACKKEQSTPFPFTDWAHVVKCLEDRPPRTPKQFCARFGFGGDIDACMREVNECRKVLDFSRVGVEKVATCVRARCQEAAKQNVTIASTSRSTEVPKASNGKVNSNTAGALTSTPLPTNSCVAQRV